MSIQIVILAAGLGKRMRSDVPKVLHPIGGRPMLALVLDTARALSPSRIVVVIGHGGEAVKASVPDDDIRWATQDPPQGTGHAVACALPALEPDGSVLILYGDVPLTTSASLAPLVAAAESGQLAIQTQVLADPTGYGRVVRDGGSTGRVRRIVEHKDATPEQLRIGEMYTGILAAPAKNLARWVGALTNDNAQREYSLTDVSARAAR